MALVKLYKFREIEECNMFLAGAIFGGDMSRQAEGIGVLGFRGIVGKVLQFTSPVGTCTFVAGASPDGFLTFKEVKTQLEAAVAGLLVLQFGGKICFIQSTPTTGTVLKGGVANNCNAAFGFSAPNNSTGIVYGSPYGDTPTPPYWMTGYSVNDNMHVIHTFE